MKYLGVISSVCCILSVGYPVYTFMIKKLLRIYRLKKHCKNKDVEYKKLKKFINSVLRDYKEGVLINHSKEGTKEIEKYWGSHQDLDIDLKMFLREYPSKCIRDCFPEKTALSKILSISSNKDVKVEEYSITEGKCIDIFFSSK